METLVHPQSRTLGIQSMYKVAALTAFGLIGFFLIMKLLELNTVVQFRYFNIVFLLFGVRRVLLRERAENDGKLEYLDGMMTGFMTAFLAAVMFSVFIFVYLNIDGGFMQYLQITQPFGSYLTPASSGLITLVEGTASGAVITFAFMHLLNRDNVQG
jgi:hypothetical protein